MRSMLLSMLLVVSVSGVVRAQQTTGPVAEQAKTEIMKLEKGKVPLLLQGGSAFADWFDRYDTDDIVLINEDGSSPTRAEQISGWRAGKRQLANNQHDHQVYIYDNGNVAVVTYVGTTTTEFKDGKVATDTVRCADTWVKQDGKWLRVVHANALISKQ